MTAHLVLFIVNLIINLLLAGILGYVIHKRKILRVIQKYEVTTEQELKLIRKILDSM